MMMSEIFNVLAYGVLGFEVAYSDLSQYVKKLFFLDREHPFFTVLLKPVKLFQKFGMIALVLMPLTILSAVHRAVYKLLECPYCTSFHVGLWTSLLVYNMPIDQSVITGLLSMFGCAIYNLIRMKMIQ